jgi:hypothetical protein
MNANEISPKANTRLTRIRNLSRLLKGLFFAYFVVVGLFFIYARTAPMLGGPANSDTFHKWVSESAGSKLYDAFGTSILLLAFVAFYRLLNLFEKAVIFSAENTLQIRRLGLLAIAYALLNACSPMFTPSEDTFSIASTLCYLLSFSLSPFLLAGGFIVIIAWIMDEGRKIQEEQELTV